MKNRKKNKAVQSKTRHNERCPECKRTIEKMLRLIYGEVHSSYDLQAGTFPIDYKASQFYYARENIYSILQNHRDYSDFVKSKKLKPVDFYVPDPGFIVEFDESQHFTKPREIALSNYPDTLQLGFDKEKWISMCSALNRKDNDPPYRDEQRAWYDTLRDFAPKMLKLKPTIRLYASDFVWCFLDLKNKSDISTFKNILNGNKQ